MARIESSSPPGVSISTSSAWRHRSWPAQWPVQLVPRSPAEWCRRERACPLAAAGPAGKLKPKAAEQPINQPRQQSAFHDFPCLPIAMQHGSLLADLPALALASYGLRARARARSSTVTPATSLPQSACRNSPAPQLCAAASPARSFIAFLPRRSMAGRKIQPRQHQVRIGRGRSSSAACASLRAPSASPVRSRTSASPACASATAVGSHRGLIQPLSLEQQPAIQILLGLAGQLLRPLSRRQRGQPRRIHLVQHQRRLAKGHRSKLRAMRSSGSAFASAPALDLAPAACFGRPLPRRLQRLRLAVVGPQLQALRQFGQRLRGVSVALQAHRQVEVVVGRVGVGGRGLPKQRSAVVALPADWQRPRCSPPQPAAIRAPRRQTPSRPWHSRRKTAATARDRSPLPARPDRCGPTLANAAAACSYCWPL